MTDRWTTEDIAREFHLSRAGVRSMIRRWRSKGIKFDVEYDLNGTKRYLRDQIRAAREQDPGRGTRTDLQKTEEN